MIDCILMGGGVPQEDDLLFEYTQGQPKALLDIAGKPMIRWVLDALERAPSVRQIVLVGLESGITSPKIVHALPNQGSMLKNIIAGVDKVLEINPDAGQVLICSTDIPLLTADMVETLIAQCGDLHVDIYHSVITRERMEARFPASRRSYVHLTEGDFAAGDIHIIAPRIVHTYEDLWDGLLNDRKDAMKQAMRLGPVFFAKLLARRLSLAELEQQVLKKFGINVRGLPVDDPEMGMDADKPFQVDICRQELSARGGV